MRDELYNGPRLRPPPFRASDRRMALFLAKAQLRLMESQLQAQMRCEATCDDAEREPSRSRFASKFGVSAERAVSTMIDRYVWEIVSAYVSEGWSQRMARLIGAQEFEFPTGVVWDATPPAGIAARELAEWERLS